MLRVISLLVAATKELTEPRPDTAAAFRSAVEHWRMAIWMLGGCLLLQSPATAQPKVAASSNGAAADPAGMALAEKAQAVLKASCYRCHGEDGTSEGGFNFVLNLNKVSKTVVSPRNAAGSLLYERITATDERVMPPPKESPRPSTDDIATIRAWIEAGAPAPAVEEQRAFITNDQVVDMILEDVRKAAERSRRFLRYFTLTHLYNAGTSEDELQTYRNAFTKLANSLSWNTDLVVPEAIDPSRTIFRIDIRNLNWNGETWTAIEEANPYFIELSSASARACYDETEARMPYVRADWFVFAASKPPLYHALLGLPSSDLELEDLLRVNVAANIEQEQTIRAAFNRSGVSQNNRLIEWHKSPYGSYWKSYDFGGNAGRQNLFAYPLGPGNGDESFEHDGGEIIFTLPNGLQAYLLVDGKGGRIDQGPTDIVSDPRRADRTVTNGVSCMSCHFAGVIPKSDEVGAVVRANPKAFQDSEDILALYRNPQELNGVLDKDSRRFAEALEKLGITSLTRSGEPISAMAVRFEQELDQRLAAAEFGMTSEDFDRRIEGCSEVTARTFGVLRVPGGTLKRDVFVASFADAAKELGLLKSTAAAPARKKSADTAAKKTPGTTTPGSSRDPAASRMTRNTPRRSRNNDDAPAAGAAAQDEVFSLDDIRWGVDCMTFSPDGDWLAMGKLDRAILLYDITKNTRIDIQEDLNALESVKTLAFTPDGSRLLAGGQSGTVVVFDVTREGRLQQAGQYVGHSKELCCLDVSDDGQFAISGGSDETLHYWKVDGCKPVGMFTGFDGAIKACRFGTGGRTALATDGETLLDISLTKRAVTRTLPLVSSWANCHAAAFSPDGEFVAVAETYSIRMWNLKEFNEMPKLEDNEIQWTLAFTPDGNRLLSGGSAKANVWDLRKRVKQTSLQTEGRGYVQALAVSEDGGLLAAQWGSSGRQIKVVKLPARRR